MGCFLRKGWTRAAPSSSIEMPSTATPCPAKSLCSLLKLGISLMQGTHHVAQKFTTTTLPDSAAVSMLPPSSFDACGSPADGAGAAAGAVAGRARAGALVIYRDAQHGDALPGEVLVQFVE